MKRIVPLLLFSLLALPARGELVHVYERTVAGAVTNQLSDTVLATGSNYVTQAAPAIDGWLFTHWSISTAQVFSERDRWGRAWDAAPYTLYEETTFTAHYLPASQDTDADGVADGHEIYWYGDLAQTADSDTDGDGFTFAEELAMGTNPLFEDEFPPGFIVWADSALLLYNPFGYSPCILRSDPEAVLFATSTNWVRPDSVVATPSYDHETTIFGYWTMDGARQADRWGRALDSVTFTMPSNAVEFVAVTSSNADERAQMYWYGGRTYLPDSDTDGDGYTFVEELAMGTNPLLADEFPPGDIEWADSALLLYNPFSMHPYSWRSEPAGALFESVTNWVRPGTPVTTPACDHDGTSFAYWTSNGAEQRDRWGRAFDVLSFAMPSNDVDLVAVTATNELDRQALYWYGSLAGSVPSDSDNDGFTFAEELAMGTNPLLADEFPPGVIEWADSALLEANLQPFEQLRTTLVGGEAKEVFTSPMAGNAAEAWAFGADLSPAVADLDGDGLFDLVLADAGGVRVLRNIGAPASPDFTEIADPFAGLAEAFAAAEPADRVIAGGEGGVYLAGDPIRFFPSDGSAAADTALSGISAWFGGELFALDPATGAVATTNGALALDTPIVRGLSIAVADADGDGFADLLASDDEGRVWFYKAVRSESSPHQSYTLQHKVWGGTFGGFAEGLKIAAVDWDDDGDLDALGGTAEGRLLMLRDPRIGRPANARIASGLNSVVLSWEPNTQSRVRGYRVYRAPGPAAEDAAFERLTSPWTPLPTYRDYPPDIRDYAYRVTTMSRFYTAGNSTPTETESRPTDLLSATLGGVTLSLRDAAGFAGEEIDVGLSVNNSLGLAASGMELVIEFDPALLTPVEAVPAGLGATLALASEIDTTADVWTIRATGGEIAAGAGTLLTLRFAAAEDYEEEATITLASAQLRATSGQTATAPTPVTGTVSLQMRTEPGSLVVAPWSKGDVDGNGKLERADLERLRVLLDYAGYSGHGGNGNGKGGPGKHESIATEQELRAGDMNENGKLEEGDYQLLYKFLKSKGAIQ